MRGTRAPCQESAWRGQQRESHSKPFPVRLCGLPQAQKQSVASLPRFGSCCLSCVVCLLVRSFSRTPTREPIGKVARDKERGKELQRSPKNSETRRGENLRVFAGKLERGNSTTKMVKNTKNIQKCHEN